MHFHVSCNLPTASATLLPFYLVYTQFLEKTPIRFPQIAWPLVLPIANWKGPPPNPPAFWIRRTDRTVGHHRPADRSQPSAPPLGGLDAAQIRRVQKLGLSNQSYRIYRLFFAPLSQGTPTCTHSPCWFLVHFFRMHTFPQLCLTLYDHISNLFLGIETHSYWATGVDPEGAVVDQHVDLSPMLAMLFGPTSTCTFYRLETLEIPTIGSK